MKLLESLADWIEFATLGAVMIVLALGILNKTPPNKLFPSAWKYLTGAEEGEWHWTAALLAAAVASLFVGFLLNQFGSWYLDPVHYHVKYQAVRSVENQERGVGTDIHFWIRPLLRKVPNQEFAVNHADNAHQLVWEICDKQTFEDDTPGSAGIKEIRLIRGTVGGAALLIATSILVLSTSYAQFWRLAIGLLLSLVAFSVYNLLDTSDDWLWLGETTIAVSVALVIGPLLLRRKQEDVAKGEEKKEEALPAGESNAAPAVKRKAAQPFDVPGWLSFSILLYVGAMLSYWHWEFDIHETLTTPFYEGIGDTFDDLRPDEDAAWSCPRGWVDAVKARQGKKDQ